MNAAAPKDKTINYRFITVTTAAIAILFGCFVVLQPFIPALLLSLIFALSAWPGFLWLERKLKGRTTLAAFIMTVSLAICFLAPMIFLGTSLADDLHQLVLEGLANLQNNYPMAPPERLVALPVVGPLIAQLWHNYGADREQLIASLRNYAGPASQWLIHFGTSVGHGILDLSLGVIITFFLFQHGVRASQFLHNLTNRFAGAWGHNLLDVSKRTMIGVVYGIVGTALVQGALAGLGFWIAQVPAAAFLGLVTFILSVVPAGFPLIWIPVTIWLFAQSHIAAGIFMAIWGAVIMGLIDLVVRPYFISLSINLPLLLIVLGVFGGLIAFGFIGLFIGPTLLALAYVLLVELGRSDKPDATDALAQGNGDGV